MALAWKDRVQQAITAGGTGALTLGAATAGHQALGAADNGKVFAGFITDGAAWETGLYTYTHATTSLARTAFYASSTGSALNASTSATWSHSLTAAGALSMDVAVQNAPPGGRLTLTSATPVTVADVAGATTVYYTPCVSESVPLWDGFRWRATEFAELAIPGSAFTGGTLPHDVVGVLTGGALGYEVVPWSSGSARATAATLTGGRVVLNGDRSRLLLGTVRPTASGTFEDSAAKRLIWNVENRRHRVLRRLDATSSWSYATTAWRQARATATNQVEVVCGLREDALALHIAAVCAGPGVAGQLGVGVNSTSVNSAEALGSQSIATGTAQGFGLATTALHDVPPLGYTYFAWLERPSGGGGVTFYGSATGPGYTAGMSGGWWA